MDEVAGGALRWKEQTSCFQCELTAQFCTLLLYLNFELSQVATYNQNN